MSVCNCFRSYGGFEPLKIMNSYLCLLPYWQHVCRNPWSAISYLRPINPHTGDTTLHANSAVPRKDVCPISISVHTE